MTTIIRCDRCGTEGDLHSKALSMESHNGLTTMEDQVGWDVCGYCASRVRTLLASKDLPVDDATELRQLRAWKADALQVLEVLESCHDALPPDARARLGHSKALAVLHYIERTTT